MAAYETTYENWPPPSYEASVDDTQVKTRPAEGEPPLIKADVQYFRSVDSILKIVEIVCNICALISVGFTPGYYYSPSGGWLDFVAATTMVTSFVIFFLHGFKIIYRFKGPWVKHEVIMLAICFFMQVISLVIALPRVYFGKGAVPAVIFIAASVAVYAVDGFRHMQTLSTSGKYYALPTNTAQHPSDDPYASLSQN